jgi:DNA helicase II / ATP-dependent DNA helicase PcrA
MTNNFDNKLHNLNEEQQAAATHIDGPLLILAGAGSGKTKTITTRLAYLISLGIDPANTLTLTFTNKAASEMRRRALDMIGGSIYPPLLCTFHKFGLLFLKFHITRLERKQNFVVIDQDDKKKIVKSFDPAFPAASISNHISSNKNNLILPPQASGAAASEFEKESARVYGKYEEYMSTNGLVDFDDLLLLPYQILSRFDDVADDTSLKYQYITVDEYQDTNHLQFELLRILCKKHSNICVVGDDDQSIYGFRGSDVANILSFADTFTGAKVVKLEQNYRSTSEILDIANKVIQNNQKRLSKKLVSVRGKGNAVVYKRFENEREEASFVAKTIKSLIAQGADPTDIAVLFRMNALSRAIEEEFTKERLPFKFVGGTMFYERAEIKDLLAYIRLVINENDDFSIKRVINKPKRGIGKTSIDKLDNFATINGISLYELGSNILYESQVSALIGKRAFSGLKELCTIVSNTKELWQKGSVLFWSGFDGFIGLKSFFASISGEEDRIRNIDEFLGMAKELFKNSPEMELDDFLNDIALVSEAEEQNHGDVSIMTVHASKGLEFDSVFVVGADDGFFPINSGTVDIEEERRLFYVAATRAKSRLYLLGAKSRFLHGERKFMPPSRFLKEAELTDEPIGVGGSADFKVYDLVRHKIFGFGRVEEVLRDGDKLRISFQGQMRELLKEFVEKAV